jgi:3D (Asp-Asp-Asp) domain-containing protein
MNFYHKVNKNSRIVGISLLFSLIQLVFPQIAISQEIIINNELSALNIELNKEAVDTYYQLPIAGEREARKTFYLTVTAYSSTVDQCDGDPFTTASGETVHDGIIAYNYLPFGTKVRFPEVFPGKVFEVQDRLRAGASTYLADIWMETREEAIQWGAKVLKIEIL